MALTVIFALGGAFVLSLTFVPAMVALAIRGRVAGERQRPDANGSPGYSPVLDFALRRRGVVLGAAAAILLGAGVLFANLGQVFVPKLDEGDIAMHAMAHSWHRHRAIHPDATRGRARCGQVA